MSKSNRDPNRHHELEQTLAQTRLPAASVNRDQLMYQAGFEAAIATQAFNGLPNANVLVRRAVQQNRFWKSLAISFGALSAVLLVATFALNGSVLPDDDLARNSVALATRDSAADKPRSVKEVPPIEPSSEHPPVAVEPGVATSNTEYEFEEADFIDPIQWVQRPFQSFSNSILRPNSNPKLGPRRSVFISTKPTSPSSKIHLMRELSAENF